MSGTRSLISQLFVMGLSHHTAPVEVREIFSGDDQQRSRWVHACMEQANLREAMVLSTCNRVELYGVSEDYAQSRSRILSTFQPPYFNTAPDVDVQRFLYDRQGEAAAQHAMRVTASLDSMVVGEPQILGQVKKAFANAQAAGTTGTLLHGCWQRSLSAAKRIRTETGIAEGNVSIGSVASDLARKIFGSLQGRSIVLVGAGDMAEAAASYLVDAGSNLTVVNRNTERGQALATRFGGTFSNFNQLQDAVTQADVVVSSTASADFIMTRASLSNVVRARKRRPLFLIDIAVPRDVDPGAASLDNVFLYDVDDLQKIAKDNLASRADAVARAESIVEEEANVLGQWAESLQLTPTIIGFKDSIATLLRKELETTLPRLSSLTEDDRSRLHAMCDAMAKKVVHAPISELKTHVQDPDGALLIHALRKLFSLDDKP